MEFVSLYINPNTSISSSQKEIVASNDYCYLPDIYDHSQRFIRKNKNVLQDTVQYDCVCDILRTYNLYVKLSKEVGISNDSFINHKMLFLELKLYGLLRHLHLNETSYAEYLDKTNCGGKDEYLVRPCSSAYQLFRKMGIGSDVVNYSNRNRRNVRSVRRNRSYSVAGSVWQADWDRLFDDDTDILSVPYRLLNKYLTIYEVNVTDRFILGAVVEYAIAAMFNLAGIDASVTGEISPKYDLIAKTKTGNYEFSIKHKSVSSQSGDIILVNSLKEDLEESVSVATILHVQNEYILYFDPSMFTIADIVENKNRSTRSLKISRVKQIVNDYKEYVIPFKFMISNFPKDEDLEKYERTSLSFYVFKKISNGIIDKDIVKKLRSL